MRKGERKRKSVTRERKVAFSCALSQKFSFCGSLPIFFLRFFGIFFLFLKKIRKDLKFLGAFGTSAFKKNGIAPVSIWHRQCPPRQIQNGCHSPYCHAVTSILISTISHDFKSHTTPSLLFLPLFSPTIFFFKTPLTLPGILQYPLPLTPFFFRYLPYHRVDIPTPFHYPPIV